jgi:hypothetical protein
MQTMMLPETRICRGACGRELPISSFRNHAKNGTAREYDCNDCHRAAKKQYRDDRKRKVIRRFCKVGQFQVLDRRLRSVGASVIRKLGGVDKVSRLWAEETKAAIQAKRTDRFALNSLNLLIRLMEFTVEGEAKKRAQRVATDDWCRMSDDQLQQRLQRGIIDVIQANPEIAVAAALELGWTLVPPTAVSADCRAG